ncbi:MAG: ABC transporter ATP-binding protein [Proteobacteria bacterium]|nr:ABC transporter ATP-binding protein [Pseudomonadota bacterium]MBU1639141.1 ABC transporter ATP-binding protein [Pseudomonadota bacterium]
MAFLDAHNISYAYGDNAVVRDVSLALEPGKFYGLIGPNGSGKTTLLDLLIANRRPSTGTISLKGQELESYSRQKLARQMALIPQEFDLGFDFRVSEIVLMGRHPHIPRFASPGPEDLAVSQEAMVALAVDHLGDRLITALSGGEKQRVVAARALAQDTPLLIMDEATANLDIQHTIQIFQVVRRKVEQGGIVLAAIHDLNLAAAFCDEIFLLKEGRLHAAGPPEEILVPTTIDQVFAINCQATFNNFNQSHQISFQWRQEKS